MEQELSSKEEVPMALYREKSLSERLTGIAASDLKLIVGAALLRGWDVTQQIWLLWWEVVVALGLIVAFTGSELVSQTIFIAFVLLVARPRAGARDLRYFLASSATLIMSLWSVGMVLMGWGLAFLQNNSLSSWHALISAVSLSSYSGVTSLQFVGAIWYLILMVLEVALLITYGIFSWSIYGIVAGLWLLDTVPGVVRYVEGVREALRAVTQGWLLLVGIVAIVTAVMYGFQALLVLWLPLHVSRFMVAVVVAPWYSALITNWYAYVRYR